MPTLSCQSKSLLRGVMRMDNAIVVDGKEELEIQTKTTKLCNVSCPKHMQLRQQKSSIDDSQAPSLVSSTSLGFSSDSDQDSLNDDSLHHHLFGSFSNYQNHLDHVACSSMSDEELLLGIEEAADQDKLLLVSKYLKEMEARNLTLADPNRHSTLRHHAELIEEVIQEHQTSPEEGGWKKHCTLHGKHRDSIIYSRLNEKNEISVRVETPMEESLLVPLLAVLNETDLYTSWIPNFQRPVRAGMCLSEKMHQSSRACQIARAQLVMPWPLANRELVVSNIVAEAVEEVGALVVGAKSLQAGEQDGCIIPACPPGFDRIGLEGGMMIRKCPKDHPVLKKRQKRHPPNEAAEEEEPLLLFSFIAGVRPSINIVTRTVAGPIWAALLSVAEDVRSGKRPLHTERIESNPMLYDWISEIVEKIKAT